jgi:hypothetical protein
MSLRVSDGSSPASLPAPSDSCSDFHWADPIFHIPGSLAEGPVLEALQKLLVTLSTQEPLILPTGSRKSSLEIVDPWLEHVAAAEYIGVARSTLYRYSEHHEIESRKFCGRLQYRLSSLDEFKSRHVRPARPFHAERGMIRSAPRSGKSEER